MDTKVRKLITCHRMHHPREERERLYAKRENVRRELTQLELTYKTATIGLKKYLDATKDWMLQLLNIHEKQKKNIQLVKKVINLLINSISHGKK